MSVALRLLELALAIGVPALIALLAPRRWRVRAVLLWALLPLVILLGWGASELLTGKTSSADLDKLIYGLLLIGSFMLLPWLMTVGVGFAIGAILRGRGPAKALAAEPPPPKPPETVAEPALPPIAETQPTPAPVHYAPRIDTDGPTLSPGGWQAVHVGFDHDDLVMDGLPVWSLPWREEPGEPVMLAHPAHPTQQHEFSVYSIDDGAKATRFATAELSNGVWGFYRWVVPADAPAGESADGSLRYEHDLGPYAGGWYDSMAPVARLYDAHSAALLFDGAAWPSSRIVPQADGSLLLSLWHGELQTIFRIDPPAADFIDLTSPDTARPLAELAGAAAAARAACDNPANAYLSRQVAPDGSIMVELQSVEWSNTHWVRSPRVTEIATGRVMLDLWGTDWDAVVSFPRRRAVRLSFRRYHFGGGAEAEIELAPDRYVLIERAGATFGTLHDLPQALEDASRRAVAEAPPRVMIPPRRPTLRNGLVALLIVAGALALIAAGTLITLRLKGEPAPQRLDTVPPMPSLPDRRPEYVPRDVPRPAREAAER